MGFSLNYAQIAGKKAWTGGGVSNGCIKFYFIKCALWGFVQWIKIYNAICIGSWGEKWGESFSFLFLEKVLWKIEHEKVFSTSRRTYENYADTKTYELVSSRAAEKFRKCWNHVWRHIAPLRFDFSNDVEIKNPSLPSSLPPSWFKVLSVWRYPENSSLMHRRVFLVSPSSSPVEKQRKILLKTKKISFAKWKSHQIFIDGKQKDFIGSPRIFSCIHLLRIVFADQGEAAKHPLPYFSLINKKEII